MRSIVAAAVAIAISGCAPGTREECLQEAAKMPTERGVSLAAGQCHQKFPPPAQPGG